jgi:L-histidine Nalpha-methyltransferase
MFSGDLRSSPRVGLITDEEQGDEEGGRLRDAVCPCCELGIARVLAAGLLEEAPVLSPVNVTFDASQFPDQVRRDLLESLRTRRINHKFHYDSVRQTHQWLALHQAYSPSRNDPECEATYDRAFAGALATVKASRVHLIGLGCGGGQKDCRLLQLLVEAQKQVFYTASDVSSAMVLVAGAAARSVIPASHCSALVCDLATATDLKLALEVHAVRDAGRLVTFFGMMPNFEPALILPQLKRFLRQEDLLLMSANLAPGPDYSAGVQRILPLYDNPLSAIGC